MGRLTDEYPYHRRQRSVIGLAVAQEFDREGARVAICGLNEGSLKAAKETLGVGSLAVRADVSNLTDPRHDVRHAQAGVRAPGTASS